MEVQRLSGKALDRSFIWLTVLYLAGTVALGYGAFLLGLITPLPEGDVCGIGARNAAELHTTCILSNGLPWATRLLVIAVFVIPVLKMVSMLTGCPTIRDLLKDMNDADNNESPLILTLGIGGAILIGCVFLPFNTPRNFLVNFGMRTSIVMIVALLGTIVLMRVGFKLKRFNHYVEYINSSGSDAIAGWTAFVYLATAAVICASRT